MLLNNHLQIFFPVFKNISQVSFQCSKSIDFFFRGSFLLSSSYALFLDGELFVHFPLVFLFSHFLFEPLLKVFSASRYAYICSIWDLVSKHPLVFNLRAIEFIEAPSDFISHRSHQFCFDYDEFFSEKNDFNLALQNYGYSFIAFHFNFLAAKPLIHPMKKNSAFFSALHSMKKNMALLHIKLQLLKKKISALSKKKLKIKNYYHYHYSFSLLYKLLAYQKISPAQFKKFSSRVVLLLRKKKYMALEKFFKKISKSQNPLPFSSPYAPVKHLKPVLSYQFIEDQFSIPLSLMDFESLSQLKKKAFFSQFMKTYPQFNGLSNALLIDAMIHFQWIT